MHTKRITAVAAMQELTQTKHGISREVANAMLKRYNSFRKKMHTAKRSGAGIPAEVPSLPICLTYNKSAIYQLMKLPGCIGIRIYFGINQKQQLSLVIVGVDEAGDNIVTGSASGASRVEIALTDENVGILDEGQASPPYPPKGF
jgi:hypothetical protein